MNRSALIKLAKSVGVAVIARGRGYESPKTNDGLRIDLMERMYGPNLGVLDAPTAAALDKVIETGLACHQGDYGYNLSMAQHSLRNANIARAELKRISLFKRRRPGKETALQQDIKEALAKCRAFQEQHLAAKAAK